MEIPFYLRNGKYRLFGVLHKADGILRKEGFVFCAPFAEEKLWAHRVMVNFARELAAKGHPVLRFDYMGNGDSEGEFEESSLETMLSDTECAISTLKNEVRGVESVNLLGLRLGATVAALVADRVKDIHKLILWEPILNGSSYMREMLRINLSTQTAVYKKILHNTDALVGMMKEGKTVNIDGYEMAWPLYEQVEKIDLLERRKACDIPALIVQISRKENYINPLLAELKDQCPMIQVAVSTDEPFWKEIRYYYSNANNLYQVTINWLEQDER